MNLLKGLEQCLYHNYVLKSCHLKKLFLRVEL